MPDFTELDEKIALKKERDEAREVARRLMAAVNYADYRDEWGELPGVLWERHPWLTTDPSARGAGEE